jgi:hypothetical protein
MPLTYSDEDMLAENGGELEPTWWPSLTVAQLGDRLMEYLEQSYASASAITDDARRNRAALAGGYVRAYDALWMLAASRPSNITINDTGSRTYTREQTDVWLLARQKWEKELQSLLPAAQQSVGAISASIRVRHTF